MTSAFFGLLDKGKRDVEGYYMSSVIKVTSIGGKLKRHVGRPISLSPCQWLTLRDYMFLVYNAYNSSTVS